MENSIEDRIEEKYTRYLNCETDTLELTIDEAMYILENDEEKNYVSDLLQEVYKIILSDYKKALKEAKKYKNMYEAEKSNEYIIYDNEKWIKEKYCVPIQEIKDIIEELEEKMFCEHNVRVLVQLYKQKQILLELLERRK